MENAGSLLFNSNAILTPPVPPRPQNLRFSTFLHGFLIVFRVLKGRSEGPPNGIMKAPGCEGWTGPRPRRRLRLSPASPPPSPRGGPKTKSFVFRRMWTISGRRRRHFDRTDLARLFLTRKINGFSTFSSPGGVWNPSGVWNPKSPNPKIQNPKT